MLDPRAPIWIICSRDRKKWLCGRTTEGKVAALIFKSGQSAAKYLGDKGLADDHEILDMPQEDFPEWLRTNYQQGITELFVNTSPDEATHSVIPIASMLIELEAKPGQEMPGLERRRTDS
jgi:hypothetical protein